MATAIVGDVVGGTVYRKFTSRDSGVPFTLAGSPVVSVYKDSDTAESTIGVTLTVDFDGRTGLNHISVDTSQDTSFYQAGHHYELVITTGTVNGTSVVSEDVGSFDLISPAGASSDVIRTATCPSQAGMTSTQIKLDSGASGSDNTYQYDAVSVTGGTGAGQSRVVLSYVGSTKVAAVDRAWVTQPDNTSVFVITATAFVRAQLADGVAHGGTPGSSTATLALERAAFVSADNVAFLLSSTNSTGTVITSNNSQALAISVLGETGGSAAISVQGGAGGGPALQLQGGSDINDGSGNGPAIYAAAGQVAVEGEDNVPSPAIYLRNFNGDVVKIITPAGHGITVRAAGADKKAFLLAGAAATDSLAIAAGAGSPIDIFDALGHVTVGGYGSGQDPATLVLDVAAADHDTTDTIGAKIGTAGAGGGDVNVTSWGGDPVPTPNVAGVPIVDVGYVLGNDVVLSSGTAQAGAASTITLASGELATNSIYNGRRISIVDGTGTGQSRFITAYVGSTKVATVHRSWTTTPDNTSQYTIDGLAETTLASSGLDAIPVTDPGGVATTFPQMLVQVWRRYFKRTVKAVSGLTIKTYADDGTTVRTTQPYTDDGLGNQTQGPAT